VNEKLFEVVGLDSLMALSSGREDFAVAVVDGPVAATHPALEGSKLTVLGDSTSNGSADVTSLACRHGTFVAGLLSSRRDGTITGICPGCPLIVRVIYSDKDTDAVPSATPRELASAITESMEAGARIVNVSGAIPSSAIISHRELNDVLDETLRRGVLVIAAAGNESRIGQTTITGHPWVVPVVPFQRDGRPLAPASLGRSIGRYGVGAPGENVSSIDSAGGSATLTGSSVAAPFVSGAAALLWSLVPTATATQVRDALIQRERHRRDTIIPPLLNAKAAYEALVRDHNRRRAYAEHGRQTPGREFLATAPAAAAWVHSR
jgi:subtilisin family serine protease